MGGDGQVQLSMNNLRFASGFARGDIPRDQESLRGSHIEIVTKEAKPFVFVNANAATISEKYSGLAIDLIERLASELEFTYDLTHVTDDTPTNDMISSVANGTYDMVIIIFLCSFLESIIDF